MKSIKMKVIASGYYHDVYITSDGLIFVDNACFLMRLFPVYHTADYEVVSICPGEIGTVLYKGSKSNVLAFLHGAISVNIKMKNKHDE
jgi:hypothetical protein